MKTVIVGGGAAADGAVSGIRDAGSVGDILLIGAEPTPPYERPPLSKRYLWEHVDTASLQLRSAEAYASAGVSLRLGEPVVELDLSRSRVVLESAETFPFDRLLIATGGRARRLDAVPDALYLRDISDAAALRAALHAEPRLTVVGGGFIGCEVAAAARTLGLEVLMLEALANPLERMLGRELGRFVADVHRSRGVEVRTQVTELPVLTGTVLVGIGSLPNDELATRAGIRTDNGILVDEAGETSHPGVFAAGDVARFRSPLYGEWVRVEHFQTAWRHGYAVGQTLAGRRTSFAEAPWFWSDQYDLNIQYTGAGVPWDELVLRGRFGQPPFTVFYLRGGRMVAAAGVNDGRTISQARRLLAARSDVSAAQLADPTVDLKRLPGGRLESGPESRQNI